MMQRHSTHLEDRTKVISLKSFIRFFYSSLRKETYTTVNETDRENNSNYV